MTQITSFQFLFSVTAVDRLSGIDRKRQDSIAELMNTEQAYIDDMSVVHEVSCH